MNFVYFNQNIVERDAVCLSVADLGILRGYGCFDFFPINDGIPLFVEDYVQRFLDSMTFLQLPFKESKEDFIQAIYTLIERNNISSGAIRMVATGGNSENAYLPASNPTILLLPENEPKVNVHYLEKGLRLKSVSYVRDYAKYKIINYVRGIKYQLDKEDIYDDVLFAYNNQVSEMPRSNIFMVNESGTILTPTSNILYGITRKCIIRCAQRLQLPIEERDFGLDEIFQAKEVFMSGSGSTLLPIQQIDENKYNLSTFAVFNALREELSKLEENT